MKEKYELIWDGIKYFTPMVLISLFLSIGSFYLLVDYLPGGIVLSILVFFGSFFGLLNFSSWWHCGM
jgi:uncharacterized membrane protein YdfJ with MMPL/SSD domain